MVYGIGEEARRLRHDCGAVRADQARDPGLNSFGPFGLGSQHEHRLTERGGLLLDAAAIGEGEGAALQKGDAPSASRT